VTTIILETMIVTNALTLKMFSRTYPLETFLS